MKARISFLVLTLLILAPCKPVKSQSTHRFNGYDLVDKEGNIRKPADYRDRYELLGTHACLIRRGTKST